MQKMTYVILCVCLLVILACILVGLHQYRVAISEGLGKQQPAQHLASVSNSSGHAKIPAPASVHTEPAVMQVPKGEREPRRPFQAEPFVWNGAPLSPQLQLALGIGNQAPTQERMVAIHELAKNLKDYEIDALCEFLLNKHRYAEDLSAVKNDILDALMAQETLPDRLQKDMLTIFRDKEYEEWWRNYVVQHFALYYPRKWPKDGVVAADDPTRQEMIHAYWDALDETRTSIAGTALLGIERMSGGYSEFDRGRIGQEALDLASDEKADVRSRTAAVQVAGKMGKAEILPMARKLANSGGSVPLRMSSIAAIGQVGGKDDAEFLRNMEKHSDGYLRKAVTSALKQLEKRTSTASTPEPAS